LGFGVAPKGPLGKYEFAGAVGEASDDPPNSEIFLGLAVSLGFFKPMFMPGPFI
jgi:hypothetical protein